ncbi:GNAT family N-acetyltransferase [Tolumonas lignilytica]|uniref:GNAT family N-acetyltransferase n=1 Tax=Tolumonas lignilytica TaxID=1283284 RepID=UPI000466266B|nr:GNAT family protein [Tolumonas lignilytica]
MEITTDYHWIRSVICHPRNWPRLAEDTTNQEAFQPNPNSIYFKHEHYGFVEARHVLSRTCELHICMLPGATGVTEFGCLVLEYLSSKGIKSVFSSIPSDNRAAIAYAKRVGMTETGRIKKSMLRRGEMIDLVIMGKTYE